MSSWRRDYGITETRGDWPFTHEKSEHSKCGQDGVLEALLGDTEKGFCIEIGSGNGEQNNTRALVNRGWEALWVDPWLSRVEPRDGVRYDFSRITADTVLGALKGSPKKFDVLSIDIDGVDYYVVAAMLKAGYRPRIAVIEYNACWGPYDAVAVVYDPEFRWARDDYFSASLQAWVELFAVYGYGLMGCESVGADAFFVQGQDVCPAAERFRPPAYNGGNGFKRSPFRPVPVVAPAPPKKRTRKKRAKPKA